ncbi:hypothetical protein GCM10009772_17790 [Pseudonocardia alni subsp. carboxydivorans]|uniref:GntR family transcriptional regulator n=1 Tax=Pseudonocardia alni subsp. carboxydivorans TaxID=415010 RepID=A0ABU9AJ09_PSEA5
MLDDLGSLDPGSAVPPYRQIAAHLRSQIVGRAPGTKLPSEAQLTSHYNCNEAQVAVDGIVEAGLDRMAGFELRFMEELPPSLGVLALDAEHLEDAGRSSFVRVQPLTASKWIGKGTVLTFQATGSRQDPFTYFASDLLEQWRVAAPDERFLEERGDALGVVRKDR